MSRHTYILKMYVYEYNDKTMPEKRNVSKNYYDIIISTSYED